MEKNKILYKLFQIFLSKKMDSENNQETIYCEDDGEYRVSSKISDLLFIERYYKNHLKSGTHANNNRKRQQLN